MNKVVELHIGNYILLQYPNRPPRQVGGVVYLYGGSLIIVIIERPDIIGQGLNLKQSHEGLYT